MRPQAAAGLPAAIAIVGNPTLVDAAYVGSSSESCGRVGRGRAFATRVTYSPFKSPSDAENRARPRHGEVAIAALRAHAASRNDVASRFRHRSPRCKSWSVTVVGCHQDQRRRQSVHLIAAWCLCLATSRQEATEPVLTAEEALYSRGGARKGGPSDHPGPRRFASSGWSAFAGSRRVHRPLRTGRL
jgi:hypothetical protein